MNLPHKEPLIFAKEIIYKRDDEVRVRCVFPTLPSLAMFMEAAAQGSAAFHPDSDPKIGYLTMVSDLFLLGDIKEKVFIFDIRKESEVGQYKKFVFEAIENVSAVKMASGKFTIYVED